MTLTRQQIVTRIYNKACKDAAFMRLFRGYTQSQVFLIINIILRARRDVAEEIQIAKGKEG